MARPLMHPWLEASYGGGHGRQVRHLEPVSRAFALLPPFG